MKTKTKLSRIDDFVNSLGNSGLTENQESVLLTCDLDSIGGNNDKNCNNASSACETTNTGCTNRGDYCKVSNNSECVNLGESGVQKDD